MDKQRVMVIEDEEMLLDAISKKLEASGYEPMKFASARAALEALEKKENLPDAIWLDYYLKDMNGIEFMKKMKDNDSWDDIPVIVVSNSASDQKVNAMVALGVKKYFLKADHRLEDIIGAISEVLPKKG